MKNDATTDWVSLREASQILGVHPTTVRNWADRGDLPSRRTPGGHRRFLRADLQQWSSTRNNARTPPAEARLIIQNAIGQARLMIGDGRMDQQGWYQAIDESARGNLRVIGRELLEHLQEYLGEPNAPNALRVPRKDGHAYAQLLLDQGLTLPQALEGFLFFNEVLQDSVVSVMEISSSRLPPEFASLLRSVHRFTNAMLLSMAEVYDGQTLAA